MILGKAFRVSCFTIIKAACTRDYSRAGMDTGAFTVAAIGVKVMVIPGQAGGVGGTVDHNTCRLLE